MANGRRMEKRLPVARYLQGVIVKRDTSGFCSNCKREVVGTITYSRSQCFVDMNDGSPDLRELSQSCTRCVPPVEMILLVFYIIPAYLYMDVVEQWNPQRRLRPLRLGNP